MARELVVTLGVDFANATRLPPSWWVDLCGILEGLKVYLRMCWLRTIAGAWTTTLRMHEAIEWKCLFGCPDEDGTISHHLSCPILWNIACGVSDGEESISVSERLCIRHPSHLKFQRLSICHYV